MSKSKPKEGDMMDMADLVKGKNYMVTIRPGSKEFEVQLLESIPDVDVIKAGLDGGMLEIVPRFTKFLGSPCIAFVDEEGQRKGLKSNFVAQFLWEAAVGRVINEDHLIGNLVIIVGSPSFLARL